MYLREPRQYLLVNHYRWRGTWLPSDEHSYFNIINVTPILSIPHFPRTRNMESNSISNPYSIFINKHLIDSIPYLPKIRNNKKYNYIYIILFPYSLFFIWSNRVYSLFAQIRNKWYNSTSIPYLIESILFLIWPEYGIRNEITCLFAILYFIKLMSL